MKQDKSKELAKAAEKKTVLLNVFHPALETLHKLIFE